jgi:predicted RNA-binding Zn-ribbon protein involved in translation (DUF1610 family)
MSITAMKQALEALEDIFGKNKVDVGAINALRQAIEQAEKQEPVAQAFESTCSETLRAQGKAYPRTCKKCGLGPCISKPQREWVEVECPLCGEMAVAHTHPNLNKREWVGLTDEDIEAAYWQTNPSFDLFARAIEAKLKELNT